LEWSLDSTRIKAEFHSNGALIPIESRLHFDVLNNHEFHEFNEFIDAERFKSHELKESLAIPFAKFINNTQSVRSQFV
jgi:hypothetical protein